MTSFESSQLITKAVSLRMSGEEQAALEILLELLGEAPDNAQANLQAAWTHDTLGLESEAAPYYERAIFLGLDREDLRDALLGLGSTYRALGRYEESLETLTRAVTEFPDDNAMRVFRALTLYNSGQAKDACEILLHLLVETTSDQSIARYRSALADYAEDLDRKWA